MSEQPGLEPGGGFAHDSLADSLAASVEGIVTAAESAAARMLQDVERAAEQQARETAAVAEHQAEQARRDAEAGVAGWMADSRRQIDSFTVRRIAVIDQRTKDAVRAAEALARALEAAISLTREAQALLRPSAGGSHALAARVGERRLS